MLLTVSLGYSQTDLIESFDGATQPGYVAEGGCTPLSMTVSTEQASTGANSLKIISNAAGSPWQGAQLLLQGAGLDLTTNKTITVDVWSEFPAGILAKVTVGGTAGTSAALHTGGSTWQTLTFNLDDESDGSGIANGVYTNLIFYPLWGPNLAVAYDGQAGAVECSTPNPNTIYIDNIIGTTPATATCTDGILNGDETGIDCGGPDCPTCPPTCTDGIENGTETGIDCGGTCPNACPAPPLVGAPAPPARLAADVLSIYSDAYTDIGVDTFDTPWCPGTTTEVMIDGNATQLLTGASCDGIDWQSKRTIDASAFTHFHIDFYTDESNLIGKVFNTKFSDWAGGAGEVSALQFNISDATTPSPQTGQWVSVDIDLTSMNPVIAGSLTRSDIVQFVLSTNLNSVWWDNLYLHKDTVLSTNEFELSEVKVYPNPTNGDWNVSGNSVISKVAVYDILGKQVIALEPNTTETVIDASSLNSGIYFARIEGLTGTKTVKLIKE